MDTSKRRTENDLSRPDVNAEEQKERPTYVQRNESQENQSSGAGPSPIARDAKKNRTYNCNRYFHSRPDDEEVGGNRISMTHERRGAVGHPFINSG